MKMKFFIVVFIILNGISAYCGGRIAVNLVNEQEMRMEHINSIEILYQSEEITLFKSNTTSLIVKEYMSIDNSNYYADISNLENKLIIKRGSRPIELFNTFRSRVEIYIPISNMDITIKTTSGSIEIVDEYICSKMNIESSSGSISVNSIMADTINLKASSGSIHGEK
jgi:DUF4097 and DUF4098 domain-containing protein YvlB